MSFQYPERSIPSSANPAPNVFPATLVNREFEDVRSDLPATVAASQRRRITRSVLDNFWLDIGFAHWSACMQTCHTHPLHAAYLRKAVENRERIVNETPAARWRAA